MSKTTAIKSPKVPLPKPTSEWEKMGPEHLCTFSSRRGYILYPKETHDAIAAAEHWLGIELGDKSKVWTSEQDGRYIPLRENLGQLREWAGKQGSHGVHRGKPFYGNHVIQCGDGWNCAVVGVEVYRTRTNRYLVLLLLDSMLAGLNDGDGDDEDE